MTLDPEFNAIKNEIEKAENTIKVGYNKENNSVVIKDNKINFITVQLPATSSIPDEIDRRLGILYQQVRGYYVQHPENLKYLGDTTHLALVNATIASTTANVVFIATGAGNLKI